MTRPRTRIEDHHAEWLSLVETSGPFLSVPALKRALPDGLEAPPAALRDLRVAYAEWQEDPGLQRRWIQWVREEPITLRSFVTLLGARRFFTVPVEGGLAQLLQESAGKQQEVADQLGGQVRRAVELLVATFDREGRDRHSDIYIVDPSRMPRRERRRRGTRGAH